MATMTEYRAELDKLDQKLLDVLAKRLEINRKVRRYKSEQSLPVVDSARELELIQNRKQYGEQIGIDPVLTEQLFRQILDYVTKEGDV